MSLSQVLWCISFYINYFRQVEKIETWFANISFRVYILNVENLSAEGNPGIRGNHGETNVMRFGPLNWGEA